MIFATVGTQLPFDRLIRALTNIIDNGGVLKLSDGTIIGA